MAKTKQTQLSALTVTVKKGKRDLVLMSIPLPFELRFTHNRDGILLSGRPLLGAKIQSSLPYLAKRSEQITVSFEPGQETRDFFEFE